MSAKKKKAEEIEEPIEENLEETSDSIEESAETETNQSPETETDDETKEGQVESLEDQLAAALKKSEENWDLMLRTKAEMENLRRRSKKDVENAHKYGLEKFINELIPVKESIELGMAAEEATVESLHEGMQLTLNMVSNAFEKMSVKEINPIDEKFDPELHQAMTMQPTDEVEPNTIINVLQKGYSLNDRLIRPAMVVVSKALE